MERAVEKNEKFESFKLESLNLKSFCLSLKEPSEVGKFLLNWQVLPKLKSFTVAGKS